MTDPPLTSSTTSSNFSAASMQILCVHANSVRPCKSHASIQTLLISQKPLCGNPPPTPILCETSFLQSLGMGGPSATLQSRLAFGQIESYSVQPRLSLAATIGHACQSQVFVWPASLMVGPYYTAPSCPTATVSYSTIYRNLCLGHLSRLAFGHSAEQAALRANQILQCAASPAAFI